MNVFLRASLNEPSSSCTCSKGKGRTCVRSAGKPNPGRFGLLGAEHAPETETVRKRHITIAVEEAFFEPLMVSYPLSVAYAVNRVRGYATMGAPGQRRRNPASER